MFGPKKTRSGPLNKVRLEKMALKNLARLFFLIIFSCRSQKRIEFCCLDTKK